MKKNPALTILISALVFSAAGISAAAGKVIISDPADNATVDAKAKIKISYEADYGATGDHIHVMVDNKRVNLVRQSKGQTEVGPLGVGKHTICFVVNTKSHAPTGSEGCVNVHAK